MEQINVKTHKGGACHLPRLPSVMPGILDGSDLTQELFIFCQIN